MKSAKLLHREDGVIHHLGLIIFGVVIVGAIGFAIYQIQNQDANYGYGSSLDEEDESQSELEYATNEADTTLDEADAELSNATALTEESDAN